VLRALEARPELRPQVAACDAPAALGQALQQTGAAAGVRAEAERRLESALAALHQLPESPIRAALEALSRAAVQRSA
jgi:geranylgeranyl pyrophosphate synthase